MNRTDRILLTLGVTAAALDTFTTWVALHHAGFQEHTAVISALIGSFGLTAGLVISVLLRAAAFSLVIIAAERFPRISTLLFGLGFTAVAITWLVVLGNIVTLANDT